MLASTADAETKVSLQLGAPVLLDGNKLKPGDYKLEWEGSGPNVELRIMLGKTLVAKVPARVVVLDTPAASDAALTLRFRGKKFALELGGASNAMQAGSSK